jgi:hypothetical protein
MSPGPLTNSHRGGFGFSNRSFQYHGGGFGRIAPPYAGRDYGARTTGLPGARQRFAVDGNGRITLDSGERLVVEVGEDGGVVIGVGNSEPTNGPGASAANGNTFASRMRRRMSLFAGNDGEIVVRPEEDNTLQVIGDPDSGAVAVIELEPAPPAGPNGGNGGNGQ